MNRRLGFKPSVSGKRSELIFLAITLNLFVLRIALPFLEYLFVPTAIVFVVYTIYKIFSEKKWLTLLKDYLAFYYLFILVGLSYLISLLYTQEYTLLVLRESLTFLFFLLLSISLIFLIRSKEHYQFFQNEFLKQITIIAVFSAILGLAKFILHLYGIDLSFLEKNGIYPAGTSLKLDHNFFALSSFLGIILLVWKLRVPLPRKGYVRYQLLMFLLTVNIFFSTSRRGIFLLAGLFIILWITVIINKTTLIRIKLNPPLPRINLYLILTLFFFISLALFVVKIDPNKKLSIIRSAGFNTSVTKNAITNITYEYSTIINRKREIQDIDKKLWPLTFNSKNPDSGWAKGKYDLVKILRGPNAKIVPTGSIGYKIDKSSGYYFTNDNAHFRAVLVDSSIDMNQSVRASVYCFVSKDFNGELVRLNAGSGSYKNSADFYDLSRKGRWQKLNILSANEGGNLSVMVHIMKKSISNLSSLEGHVILAFPEYQKLSFDPRNPQSGWGYLHNGEVFQMPEENNQIVPAGAVGIKIDSSAIAHGENTRSVWSIYLAKPSVGVGNSGKASIYCWVSKDFEGTKAGLGSNASFSQGNLRHFYNMNEKGIWQKLEINFIATKQNVPIFLMVSRQGSKSFSGMKGSVIFAYPRIERFQDSIISPNGNSADANLALSGFIEEIFNDSLVKLQKALFLSYLFTNPILMRSETTDSLFFLESKNILTGNRIDRLRFAIDYYKKEYNGIEKLFGGGFDYLPAYGLAFFNDPDHMDYPHNTLVSAILYSGILGGIIYLLFMIQSVYYYIRYRIFHPIFEVLFLITFFFVFFSSNSHFELPLFTFLSIVPFFTKYLVKKGL